MYNIGRQKGTDTIILRLFAQNSMLYIILVCVVYIFILPTLLPVLGLTASKAMRGDPVSQDIRDEMTVPFSECLVSRNRDLLSARPFYGPLPDPIPLLTRSS